MVHPFLRRRQGLEPVSYPKDEIKPALERTWGVPIFQEQVMQIAMLAANFSAGDADRLRRSMASWRRKGDLGQYQEKLRRGMAEKGYEEEFIEAIVRQIEGFAEYGFPESHAASFALLAYASSWIKRHEPAIFLTALLNSQPMGFYSPSQLVQDARRHGVEVRPVDVCHSHWETTLEAGTGGMDSQPAVRLGMQMVRGLSREAALRIMAAHSGAGFSELQDLARRAQLARRDLQALAEADALKALSGHRRQALWQSLAAESDKDLLRAAPLAEDPLLLQAPTEGEQIVSDYRALGLTLGRHPLALLRPLLAKKRFLPAEVLNTFENGQFARACGIVTVRQRPQTASGTMFFTLEDESGPVNVIVWPALIERYRKELLGAPLLGVYGIWQCESTVRHLVAKMLLDLSPLLGRLTTKSRDFM
jgi:error-prone DNA polymerase